VNVNPRIINVLDPSLVGDWLATPQGETLIVKERVMRKNGIAAFTRGA
jgi:hypothetical protein